MRIAARVREVPEPAIVSVNARVGEMLRAGREVLNLGQGVPDLTPPADCLETLQNLLPEPWLHRYTVDPGQPALRQALAEDYRRRWGVAVDPDTEVIITVGANHAFFQAALTCLEPGDVVALPGPYYFNHPMALTMLGIGWREWPMRWEGERWALDFEGLRDWREGEPGGLVCICPNNPTGNVFLPSEIDQLTAYAAEREIPLFYDEVYHLLNFGDTPLRHPFQTDAGRASTVVLGSFSKVFGMTGWRVGYVIAAPPVIREMLKVQDSTVICAPGPAQFLAAECLRRRPDFPAPYRQTLRRRAECLAKAFLPVAEVRWHAPAGAIFGMLSLPPGWGSPDFCLGLLEAEGVATIPGSAFGRSGEGMVRISFGLVEEDLLAEAVSRIARYCRQK